ncbi:hypothetical protein [Rhodococcus sp. RS1C4]|nr:hypothetical protein [Rhodococcus sp. RS1C4]
MSSKLYQDLAGAVSRAKAGAPLARVTVVAPTRGAIRDVLQYLAHYGGVVNVQVLTVDLAVTKLAAPALTPRLPLPFPLLDASVQKILIDFPGVFADVADQPITAEALAGASRTLGAVANPDAPDATPLVRDMPHPRGRNQCPLGHALLAPRGLYGRSRTHQRAGRGNHLPTHRTRRRSC